MRTLSDKPGNPANGLKASYTELMALTDPAELHARATKIATEYLDHGFSAKHYIRFIMTINQIKDDLPKMQGFISNFILKADGTGVIRDFSKR